MFSLCLNARKEGVAASVFHPLIQLLYLNSYRAFKEMIAKASIWSTTHPRNLSHTAHLKAVAGVPKLCCLSSSSYATSSINSTCKDGTHSNQWKLLTMLIHQELFWYLRLHVLQNLHGSKINNNKSPNQTFFCSSWCPVNSFTDVSFMMVVHVENTFCTIEEFFAAIPQVNTMPNWKYGITL